ncbi:MAG: glutamate-5-semialdehyde dehydrogenase [Bacteroidales bacterium]|nr:glutamate-5-semialdehyde dehydrogenase [Bacteroidales bacterium]
MDCTQIFENVRDAGYKLGLVENDKIVEVLIDIASELELFQSEILYANQEDLDNMEVNNPKYDRLKLTEGRIRVIADDLRSVAKLPSPAGRLLSEFVRPDGLIIRRFTVPFGVIGIIYEARPDVTLNAFSLCFKSGNACILKGGSDAINTNTALVSLIRRVLVKHDVEENIVALLPAGREETRYLLNARNYVDLLIPRGGRDLIDFVRKNAEIPVIETGAGICHTFFEKTGDREKARKIVLNAKTRRVSVCNALDCLVIEKSRVEDLPYIVAPLAEKNVVIYADNISWEHLDGSYPDNLLEHATEESYGTEFLDYKMSIKAVENFEEALLHISKFSSKHSESIVSEDKGKIETFIRIVDAAVVYSNASTAFTDGAQFGLGAEIGISTQKLHARGPMALEALCTYKWVVEGDGQVRNS